MYCTGESTSLIKQDLFLNVYQLYISIIQPIGYNTNRRIYTQMDKSKKNVSKELFSLKQVIRKCRCIAPHYYPSPTHLRMLLDVTLS